MASEDDSTKLGAMGRTLLAGGVVLDPEARGGLRADLLLDRGRIAALIGPNDAAPDDARRIDVSGLQVAPGFIDLHVHDAAIFQPFGKIEDSIRSAAASAVRHGVTASLVTTVAWGMTRVMEFVSEYASIASWGAADGTVPIGLSAITAKIRPLTKSPNTYQPARSGIAEPR